MSLWGKELWAKKTLLITYSIRCIPLGILFLVHFSCTFYRRSSKNFFRTLLLSPLHFYVGFYRITFEIVILFSLFPQIVKVLFSTITMSIRTYSNELVRSSTVRFCIRTYLPVCTYCPYVSVRNTIVILFLEFLLSHKSYS